ncbi:MAG: CPBP family intramembrane glutamic endopeptidase [archaeon]
MHINQLSLKEISTSVFFGALLYFVNVSFISWMFAAYPETQALVFGKGTWWLGAALSVKVVYVGLIGPVFEELVFRRALLGYFAGRGQQIFGLALSTILFGGYHLLFGWGMLKAVLMIVPGLVFGVMFLKYGFKGCLTCHLSNNILAVWALANS